MSRSAMASRNVRNEINMAFSEKKDLIVAFLENARLSSGMKLQIGTVQHINRFGTTEAKFLESLRPVLNAEIKK